MKKALIAFLLAIILLATFTLAACGTKDLAQNKNQDQDTDQNVEAPLITGPFNYYAALSEELLEDTYYYSDDYFSVSGKEDNAHLLTLSFCLAIASGERLNYTHLGKMLDEMGFEDPVAEDIYEKPAADSIGTIIAHKKIGRKNVIAVVIRSYMYDSEWASNFTAGKTGDAKGFSDSRDKVIERLKNYISKHDLQNNKIWVTGYSRGAAISDLVGVTLNNDLNSFLTTEDDLYIYAFEPAAACADDTVYGNINIIVNASDPVVYLYPSSWDMHLNGKVTVIGEEKTVMSYKNILSPEEYKEIASGQMLTEIFEWLSSRLSRENYAETLEKPAADILDLIFHKTVDEREVLLQYLLRVGDALRNDFMVQIQVSALVMRAIAHRSDYLYNRITDILVSVLDANYSGNVAEVLTVEEYEMFKSSLYPILRTLLPIVIDDIHYYDGIDYDEFYANELPDYYLSDYDYGFKMGVDNGDGYGYSDGFNGKNKNDTPKDMNDFGKEYQKGYAEGYKNAYAEAYERGTDHAENIILRADYEGAKTGKERGVSDGKSGQNPSPRDPFFFKESWMTEEYVEAYNTAFAESYAIGYEEGTLMGAGQTHEDMNTYHIISIVENAAELIKNHLSENVFQYLKAMDSYYIE